MADDLLKRLVDAACAVYRVTDRLPADDSIVRLLRESALVATASCAVSFYTPEAYNINKAHSDIETLCGYFIIARQQNWVDFRNFDVLLAEYQAIKNELISSGGRPGGPTGRPGKSGVPSSSDQISPRQKKIFAHMNDAQGREVSLKDLRVLFPTIAARTVQRDVQALLEKGIVVKKGTTHNTTYYLAE